jgi:Calx-beta domain
VSFSRPTLTGVEVVGTVRLPVALSRASGKTISVRYAVTGGTATRGVDYVFAALTLTFRPGETLLYLPLTIRGDTRIEPSETVAVTLSAPVNVALGR